MRIISLSLLVISLLTFSGCRTFISSYDEPIMANGISSPTQMVNFFRSTNPNFSYKSMLPFAICYIEESKAEGVNHDVAWVQMCLETNFLRFGGQVLASQNNFCGLGALDGGAKGASFRTPRLGIRAQIQHLKAYASKSRLFHELVDPRFHYVKRGCAPYISGLTKRWASDPNYHDKLAVMLGKLRDF